MSSPSLTNIASRVLSFIHVILWCVIFSLIFAFQDFYLCFRPIIRSLPRLFLHVSEGCRGPSVESRIATAESCFEWKTIACSDAPTSVSVEDMSIVFESLGLDRDARKGDGRQQMARQGSRVDVANVFYKAQPSLDEVREAFNIFDGNNDGFIDANELERVINSMGFMRFSKEEYQRMIMAFDYNGDGKIDFREFVKLMEDCS
ncbi:hypothetical protein F511_21740 [Dorcoceras hygrometricum]|uniref:EF-hand domain-containing protein n=1 Tax=Dorcoceras hygrometricum TaxID=472368 RepID=A0A2Z7BJH4_9LAMI|nr:hypothetical protein F511_21740 [Dorcoceras hygrometricum]